MKPSSLEELNGTNDDKIITLLFNDLKQRTKTSSPIFFTLPPEYMAGMYISNPDSIHIELLSKLIDSCPLCDSSRYELWMGYSECFRSFFTTSTCNFDPIVGYSMKAPFLVPFSVNNSDEKIITKLIYDNILPDLCLFSDNCKGCGQILHIECVRAASSTVFPLIYQRDSDKQGHRSSSGLLFPEAVLSTDFLLCPDCSYDCDSNRNSSFPTNNTICSRCWRCLPTADALIKVPVKQLGTKDEVFSSEYVCNSCLECSHCYSLPHDEYNHAHLGLPRKNTTVPWGCIWIFSNPPLSLLLCGGCTSAMDTNNYCPLCCQMYDLNNFSIPMASCDKCNKWIHIECDPILNLSWYIKAASDKHNNLKYECLRCRENNLLPNDDLHVNIKPIPIKNPVYFPTGTWILERGFFSYSSLSCFSINEFNDTKEILPLGLIAARYVPSFRNPGQKTLLTIRISSSRKSLPSSSSSHELEPLIKVQFLDDFNTLDNGCNKSRCHTYNLFKASEWYQLWNDLWLKWTGHKPPFSRTFSLTSILGMGINDPKLKEFAYRSSLTHRPSTCSRMIPNHKRKQLPGRGSLTLAISGRELVCFGNSVLTIERSSIQGLGVFSKSFISANLPLLIYHGVVVSPHVADNLEFLYESLELGCYFFKISSSLIIDATLGGSAARFVNHSCDPNCIAKSICSLKRPLHKSKISSHVNCSSNCSPNCSIVIIYSKRDIIPGEELTYDYMFKLEGDPVRRIPCGCKSLRCRGYMN